MSERLQQQLDAHVALVGETTALLETVERLGETLCRALAAGGKLITFGNGGSAADAQHFAAELAGRFRRERPPLPAIALTTDSSVLTAIANDYAYEDTFARQITAIANRGDVVVGISTSGRSQNVLRGLTAARERGALTVALTGQGGPVAEAADHVLAVPSRETARVQEVHILFIHMLSEIVDEWAAVRAAER